MRESRQRCAYSSLKLLKKLYKAGSDTLTDEAASCLDIAKDCESNGDFLNAFRYRWYYHDIVGDETSARYGLAEAYRKIGMLDKALTIIKDLIKDLLRERNNSTAYLFDVYLTLGNIYFQKTGLTYYSPTDCNMAIDAYLKGLALGPTLERELIDQHEEFLKYLETRRDYFINLATLEMNRERYNEAAKYLENAFSVADRLIQKSRCSPVLVSIRCVIIKAKLQIAQCKYMEAKRTLINSVYIEYIKKKFEKEYIFIEYLELLIKVLNYLREFDNAMAFVRVMIDISRIVCGEDSADYASSIELEEKIKSLKGLNIDKLTTETLNRLALDPNDQEFEYNLETLVTPIKEIGAVDKGIVLCEKLRALPLTERNRFIVYDQMDYENSVEFYTKARRIAIDDLEKSSLDHDISEIMIKMGDRDRGISLLKQAYQICPKDNVEDQYQILFSLAKTDVAYEKSLNEFLKQINFNEDVPASVIKFVERIESTNYFSGRKQSNATSKLTVQPMTKAKKKFNNAELTLSEDLALEESSSDEDDEKPKTKKRKSVNSNNEENYEEIKDRIPLLQDDDVDAIESDLKSNDGIWSSDEDVPINDIDIPTDNKVQQRYSRQNQRHTEIVISSSDDEMSTDRHMHVRDAPFLNDSQNHKSNLYERNKNEKSPSDRTKNHKSPTNKQNFIKRTSTNQEMTVEKSKSSNLLEKVKSASNNCVVKRQSPFQ
ncbi:hypothetical protein ROZALSC1DRAFT_30700 [Rozella allomycis CSF55]|uniref:Tetratricopeptide-like helical domain-containing protein n=1 Tax=Rozella allomycis (strain CSF55) TaxID=988480 RepID=A0A4V1IZB7_ROZAC|nr:hypothetical protein ROZALSC1DRAFT_30700 [Rozella allomycis CSF55]